MLLASVADLRNDLGFDDMTDVNTAITDALDAAESQLSTDLNTIFTKQAFTDTFYIREPCFERGRAVRTELRLSEGFVSAMSSIVLYDLLPGSTGAPDDQYFYVQTLDQAPFNGTDMTATFSLDATRGVLKNFITRFRDQFIVATYTSGFDADPDTPDSYLLSQVPQWLQEAAKLRAKIFLADAAVVKDTNTAIDTTLLGKQVKGALARSKRYTPCAILPM